LQRKAVDSATAVASGRSIARAANVGRKNSRTNVSQRNCAIAAASGRMAASAFFAGQATVVKKRSERRPTVDDEYIMSERVLVLVETFCAEAFLYF
jgi:demethoxyubiquinone hydroxylase (CLK1/Coq7/Cat5 family)